MFRSYVTREGHVWQHQGCKHSGRSQARVLPCKYNCRELVRQDILGLGTSHQAANWDRQEKKHPNPETKGLPRARAIASAPLGTSSLLYTISRRCVTSLSLSTHCGVSKACTTALCYCKLDCSALRTMTGQTAVTLKEPTGDVVVHVVKDFTIPSPGEGEVSARLAMQILLCSLFFAGSVPSVLV